MGRKLREFEWAWRKVNKIIPLRERLLPYPKKMIDEFIEWRNEVTNSNRNIIFDFERKLGLPTYDSPFLKSYIVDDENLIRENISNQRKRALLTPDHYDYEYQGHHIPEEEDIRNMFNDFHKNISIENLTSETCVEILQSATYRTLSDKYRDLIDTLNTKYSNKFQHIPINCFLLLFGCTLFLNEETTNITLQYLYSDTEINYFRNVWGFEIFQYPREYVHIVPYDFGEDESLNIDNEDIAIINGWKPSIADRCKEVVKEVKASYDPYMKHRNYRNGLELRILYAGYPSSLEEYIIYTFSPNNYYTTTDSSNNSNIQGYISIACKTDMEQQCIDNHTPDVNPQSMKKVFDYLLPSINEDMETYCKYGLRAVKFREKRWIDFARLGDVNHCIQETNKYDMRLQAVNKLWDSELMPYTNWYIENVHFLHKRDIGMFLRTAKPTGISVEDDIDTTIGCGDVKIFNFTEKDLLLSDDSYPANLNKVTNTEFYFPNKYDLTTRKFTIDFQDYIKQKSEIILGYFCYNKHNGYFKHCSFPVEMPITKKLANVFKLYNQWLWYGEKEQPLDKYQLISKIMDLRLPEISEMLRNVIINISNSLYKTPTIENQNWNSEWERARAIFINDIITPSEINKAAWEKNPYREFYELSKCNESLIENQEDTEQRIGMRLFTLLYSIISKPWDYLDNSWKDTKDICGYRVTWAHKCFLSFIKKIAVPPVEENGEYNYDEDVLSLYIPNRRRYIRLPQYQYTFYDLHRCFSNELGWITPNQIYFFKTGDKAYPFPEWFRRKYNLPCAGLPYDEDVDLHILEELGGTMIEGRIFYDTRIDEVWLNHFFFDLNELIKFCRGDILVEKYKNRGYLKAIPVIPKIFNLYENPTSTPKKNQGVSLPYIPDEIDDFRDSNIDTATRHKKYNINTYTQYSSARGAYALNCKQKEL